MAYFGITEEQHKSQVLFEYIFQMKFNKDFFHVDTKSSAVTISDKRLKVIKSLNSLVSIFL